MIIKLELIFDNYVIVQNANTNIDRLLTEGCEVLRTRHGGYKASHQHPAQRLGECGSLELARFVRLPPPLPPLVFEQMEGR
jgi:hypothetical protein